MTVPEPVVFWRCGDDYYTEEPRACTCDNPEMQADVGPHDTNGDEIAKYHAYPASTDPVPALVAENARLREALRDVIDVCDHAAPEAFDNGVTTPSGDADEGTIKAWALIAKARALLPAPPVTEADRRGEDGEAVDAARDIK